MPISPLHGYIGAGIAVAAFLAGWSVNGWRYQSREAKALETALAARDEANERANLIAADYEALRASLEYQSDRVQTEVRTFYRDRTISPDCAVPAGAASLLDNARRVANAAITGEPSSALPDDPGGPAD